MMWIEYVDIKCPIKIAWKMGEKRNGSSYKFLTLLMNWSIITWK